MAKLYISDDKDVQVTLSERNLLTLLSKLYTPGSFATITSERGGSLILVAEKDDDHYNDSADPGVMHPTTERILKAIREVVEKEELEI